MFCALLLLIARVVITNIISKLFQNPYWFKKKIIYAEAMPFCPSLKKKKKKNYLLNVDKQNWSLSTIFFLYETFLYSKHT